MLVPTLSQTLRALLLWLTLLAFPGLAAAAAQPCALHAHGGVTLSVSAAASMHAAPQASIRMAAMPAQAMAPAAPACHQPAAADQGHGTREHGHCSACAACCAGVAPAPAIPRAPGGPGPAYVAVPFRPGHLPSVDPFPLERPPRPAPV